MRRRLLIILTVVTVVAVAGLAVPAAALTSSRTDPTDAPAGPQGKTDLRSITWNVGASTTTATISVVNSTFGSGERAVLGVHLLVDNDRDGLADGEVAAARNADGVKIDIALRVLDRTQSVGDCQDLDGKNADIGTVVSTIANGLETFHFTFATSAIPGGLSHFRWAAFGQSPGTTASTGPWDYLPNTTNPDPAAANPGDRRCDSGKTGVALRMSAGVDSNAAPTATVKNGQCSASNARAATINVTLADQNADPVTLALGSNSNPVLVPNGNVVLGGSGYNRTVTVTAAPNKSGSATLSFNVSDGTSTVHLVATVIVGTSSSETLNGTSGADVVLGLASSNTINGNGGNDLLCGGASVDTLNGGAGNDTLTGFAGGDKFSGGAGTDTVTDFNAAAGDTKDGTIP